MTRDQLVDARVRQYELAQQPLAEVAPQVDPGIAHVAGAIAVARAAAAEL